MASAKPGVHIVQLKPVAVPKYMQEGEKFIKWDEDSGSICPVTLKVDEHGFYLYWTNLNKDVDLLDISTIRDTRTSRFSRIPRDPKLRQQINYGSATDPIEDKTITVVTGPDFVNLQFHTFTTEKRETAKNWCTDLLKIAHNILQLNSPIMSFLRKIHSRLTILTDKNNKIPVKNIVKTFAVNKDDKKKVEKALAEATNCNVGKTDVLDSFPFSAFFDFYKRLTTRTDVYRVYEKFASSSQMSAEDFMEFINKEQRDPRLNEILYPYATPEKAKELIETYEPAESVRKKGAISFEGFLRYLLSEDNAVVSYEKYDLADDMDQPLCHYFINSSHNTYLTGHQLTGKSSVEMYRQALLAGCRCVELDFWNGRTEEPVIVHGYTLVPDIPAKDVIEAIADSAFKTSDYPVVLSFENHCNPKQQAKIAQYCREFFGDMLLEHPLESHPIEPGVPLPAPSMLKRKIIIKNKKKHHHHHHHHKTVSKKYSHESASVSNSFSGDGESSGPTPTAQSHRDYLSSSPSTSSSESEYEDDDYDEGDEDSSSTAKNSTDKGTAGKESEAGAEISALVNYVQPVHFYSFEASLARNKAYEMSSFDEKQAMTLLKERPVEFVNYNKYQLSRVYPRGTRVDSANFMPQLFWNAGCQLVALNYQTLDLAMQLNLGIFEMNGKCGYLLKPEFMRRKDRQFDPFAESTVDGIIAGKVSIQVISGQFMSEKKLNTYVEVEMYGLPTDTVRKRFRTKTIQGNGLNPVYDEEAFVFKKVVLPELACVRLVAYEEGGKPIGHRVIPVIGLRPGYRHIVLRNESGQPLNLPTIFVHISVKDYVPDGLSDFAEALANPIKYQSQLDKRTKQLEVLQDDNEALDETESTSEGKPEEVTTSSVEPKPSPVAKTSFNQSIRRKEELAKAESTSIDHCDRVVVGGPPPPQDLASYGVEGNKVAFVADSLDKFLEFKAVKEKQGSVQKKVEELKKKHEKEKKKLTKKLSMKHMDPSSLDSGGSSFEKAERECREKGQEEISKLVEKSIRDCQSKQMKLLYQLEEKETAEVMKWIYNWRKDEYRRLSKLTRDKNELGRMKREVNTILVNKGVEERERKATIYNDIRNKLQRDHERVLSDFQKWKTNHIIP